MKKYVVDTSVVIEKIVTKLAKEKKIEGTILVPHAVVSELENQANRGQEIGFLGLEEIQEIRKFKFLNVEFVGERPTETQIKFAKSGEIDAYIRLLAAENKATLITADKVQAESGKAFGLDVIYIERKPAKEKLTIEEYFDDTTMSLHLKENCYAYGKKGKPGEWKLVQIGNEKLTCEKLDEIEKEILEKARVDREAFMEISRKGISVIQYRNFRIVAVKTPVADGHEITVVRPLKKLNLDYYKLPAELNDRIKEKSRGIIIAGEPGSGKCHGKDTPILMHDGTIKLVQDVKEGDRIMGPDSKPRRVLSSARGYGKLYRVNPVKGDSYVVNENHILSLKFNNHYKERTINLSVKDFLNKSEHFKYRCKGYRTSIDFPEKDVPIDPYFLGLWLGDGLSESLRISNSEPQIIEFLDYYAEENGLVLRQHSFNEGPCHTYGITTGKRGGIVVNPLLNKMKTLQLIKNKHIPFIYKVNSRDIRLNLLAGLIDTDGYVHSNCIEIATKFEKLKWDILYLARSLGFAAYYSEKFVNDRKYFRINISGDISIIPTRLKRKIGLQRKQVKDVLRTGIGIDYIGEGDYYGFELSGDGLYCLADFTVTHNSTFAQAMAEFYLKQGKVVKTVESPRDLDLPDEITQYSKNFASSESIHDILFLSRPDNIIFDEMRDTPDFELYTDLRLAGSECIGVIHSASPIDAVQRFITRMEVGMIPSVVDTILFVSRGNIAGSLSLKMEVKVPSGMVEADLARPVVEVRDFLSGKLTHEIYSYGEQTVVVPVSEVKNVSGIKSLAAKEIKRELGKHSRNVEVELLSDNKCVVYVPEDDIARIIGAKGKTITEIEEKLGIGIEVKELKSEKSAIKFEINEDKNHVTFYVKPGATVDIFVEDNFLTTAIASKKGEIRIHKKSQLGRDVLKALDSRKNIELKA